jgi:hypothetical protein
MAATTVKLESELLRKIAKAKGPTQTLAAFVREAVENDLRRRQLRVAAEAYQQFLSKNKTERRDLEEWEKADLSNVPKRKRR